MKLYRYQFISSDLLVNELDLMEYEVIRETEKYYVIDIFLGDERRVRKDENVRKAFARISKEKALKDFIYRYKKYKQILEHNLEKVEQGLYLAEKLIKR